MQAAETAKPSSTDSGALQIWQNYCAGVANDDVFYISAAVYKNSDLSIYFSRYLGQMAGKFLGNDFARRNASLI